MEATVLGRGPQSSMTFQAPVLLSQILDQQKQGIRKGGRALLRTLSKPLRRTLKELSAPQSQRYAPRKIH